MRPNLAGCGVAPARLSALSDEQPLFSRSVQPIVSRTKKTNDFGCVRDSAKIDPDCRTKGELRDDNNWRQHSTGEPVVEALCSAAPERRDFAKEKAVGNNAEAHKMLERQPRPKRCIASKSRPYPL